MLISVIGTRPQYIKVKPVYDYCIRHKIPHTIIDTNQHYSENMSTDIIKSLGIENICKLMVENKQELLFVSQIIEALYSYLRERKKDKVLVYGDTNSTFCAALVCYKLGISLGHVEAGSRCFNNKIPEEINRIFTDEVSDFGFCFAEKDLKNVTNGVLSGDVEYELLNNLDIPNPNLTGPVVLTIHRKENLTKEKISEILFFCERLSCPVLWPIHHSVQNSCFFSELKVPKNIRIVPPYDYRKMVDALNSARFIISDSGGLLKTAPFFGKRILILRGEVGRTEVIDKGYGKFATFLDEDIDWLLKLSEPDRNFFLYDIPPSECIVETMNSSMGGRT